MPRNNGPVRRIRNRTGLRNKKHHGIGSYAAKNKGRKADVYDRPALNYRDPALNTVRTEENE